MPKKITVLEILPDFFDVYLLKLRGLSQNTVTSYKYTFQLLYEYLYSEKGLKPNKVTFSDLESGTIEKFLIWIEKERNCSVSTRNLRKAAISSFSKYALRNYFTYSMRFSSEVSAIESKKSQKKSISNFSTEEIQIILSLPKKSNDTELRNRAILCFLYGSGARAQELCNLRVSDVKFGEKTSVRLLGKGNKRRVVVLPTACANILKEHILRCDISQYGERHVFSSHTHEKMSVSCVEAIVAKYVRIAKKEYSDLFREEHYSPHSFRHSIAVHMLEADIPLPVIKTFLGHENIQTTMVYATVSDRVKDKYLLNRYFPNTAHENELKKYSVKEDLIFL
jgi:phage recombinase